MQQESEAELDKLESMRERLRRHLDGLQGRHGGDHQVAAGHDRRGPVRNRSGPNRRDHHDPEPERAGLTSSGVLTPPALAFPRADITIL